MSKNYSTLEIILLGSFRSPRYQDDLPEIPEFAPYSNWKIALRCDPQQCLDKMYAAGLIEPLSALEQLAYLIPDDAFTRMLMDGSTELKGTYEERLKNFCALPEVEDLVSQRRLWRLSSEGERLISHYWQEQKQERDGESVLFRQWWKWLLVTAASGVIGNRADWSLLTALSSVLAKLRHSPTPAKDAIKFFELTPLPGLGDTDLILKKSVYSDGMFYAAADFFYAAVDHNKTRIVEVQVSSTHSMVNIIQGTLYIASEKYLQRKLGVKHVDIKDCLGKTLEFLKRDSIPLKIANRRNPELPLATNNLQGKSECAFEYIWDESVLLFISINYIGASLHDGMNYQDVVLGPIRALP